MGVLAGSPGGPGALPGRSALPGSFMGKLSRTGELYEEAFPYRGAVPYRAALLGSFIRKPYQVTGELCLTGEPYWEPYRSPHPIARPRGLNHLRSLTGTHPQQGQPLVKTPGQKGPRSRCSPNPPEIHIDCHSFSF